ncbi:MAG: hypothetical protein RIR17_2012 [Planctomycetota bacterium]|jgi:hypothetical protein
MLFAIHFGNVPSTLFPEVIMLLVDEPKLESDLSYRIDYLCKFMGFEQSDIQLIHDSATVLAPLVPVLVDADYEKLH